MKMSQTTSVHQESAIHNHTFKPGGELLMQFRQPVI